MNLMDHGIPQQHQYSDEGREDIERYQQWDDSRVKEKIEKVKSRIKDIEDQLPNVGIYGRRLLIQTLGELEREMKELLEEITKEAEDPVDGSS